MKKVRNFQKKLKKITGISTPFGGVSWQSSSTGAELRLVDVLINKIDKFPKIEIKVRNIGDQVAFLKKAEFIVLGQWNIFPNPDAKPYAVPISCTYDVEIPRQGTVTVNISQAVDPGSVDRFEFRLVPKPDHYFPLRRFISNRDNLFSLPLYSSFYPYVGLFLYLLRIKLIYNEDNRVLATPPILLHIPPPVSLHGLLTPPTSTKALEENKRISMEILKNIDNKTIIQEGILEEIKSLATS